MNQFDWYTCTEPLQIVKFVKSIFIPAYGDIEFESLGILSLDDPATCDTLRDVIGDPWRYYAKSKDGIPTGREVIFHKVEDSWYSDDVVLLAKSISKFGNTNVTDFRMLYDALVDVGCRDSYLRDHLKIKKHHQACWAARLLSTKQ